MAAEADLKHCELFGWDCQIVCPLTEPEVAWHVMGAERTGGPAMPAVAGA